MRELDIREIKIVSGGGNALDMLNGIIVGGGAGSATGAGLVASGVIRGGATGASRGGIYGAAAGAVIGGAAGGYDWYQDSKKNSTKDGSGYGSSSSDGCDY